MLYTKITECRICHNTDLQSVLDLGKMALTGLFPMPGQEVEEGPLELVKCTGKDSCGLLQLAHNYDMEALYGDNYGYRSGLNKGMVKHLGTIVETAKSLVSLEPGDLVIDIASNDGTMLSAYGDNGYDLLGIDPTSKKFSQYYPSYVNYISDFFSIENIRTYTDKKAKIITSISMFYDLPDPSDFVQQIKDTLDDDGIWILEQSYMPTMIDMVSYDTVCHEHLEYYALRQIKWLVDRAGMKIINVVLNDVNGGSFQVTVAKNLERKANDEHIAKLLREEDEGGYTSGAAFEQFKKDIAIHKEQVLEFFDTAKKEGKKVFGYGSSTKGNVTLQYCGISKEMLPYIAEVNEYKFGRTSPGTKIAIISETDAHAMNPDYYFVLPWHFRKGITERESNFLASGGHLVFPLPKLDIV